MDGNTQNFIHEANFAALTFVFLLYFHLYISVQLYSSDLSSKIMLDITAIQCASAMNAGAP